MIEFDNSKSLFEVTVPVQFTANDISDIIVNSFEGGSTYWLGFSKSDNPLFNDKPKDEPISTWSAKLLIEGHTLYLFDREDEEERFELTLDKLKMGIKQYITKNKSYDKEDWDGDSVDSIVQYALFGKLIYG